MMTSERIVISTERAPKALGPYSQGVRSGELVFTAGQIPLNPATGVLNTGTIEEQTHQVLGNLAAVLEAAGSSLHHVVKTTVFLADLNDFQRMNAVYAGYFSDKPPARSTVQVSKLPLGASIEIECIAVAK